MLHTYVCLWCSQVQQVWCMLHWKRVMLCFAWVICMLQIYYLTGSFGFAWAIYSSRDNYTLFVCFCNWQSGQLQRLLIVFAKVLVIVWVVNVYYCSVIALSEKIKVRKQWCMSFFLWCHFFLMTSCSHCHFPVVANSKHQLMPSLHNFCLSGDTFHTQSLSFWWHFLTQFLFFLMTLPYTIPLLSDGISLCHPYTVSLYGGTFLTLFLFFMVTWHLPYTIPHLSDDTSLHNSSSFWWHFLTQFFFLMTLPYTVPLLSDDTSLHNSSSFWWYYTIPLLSDGISLCHPYTISLYGGTFLTQFLFFMVTPSLHNSSSFWWHFPTQFLFFLMTLPYTIPLLSDDTSLHSSSSSWWHLPYTISFLSDSISLCCPYIILYTIPLLSDDICGHCDFFLWLATP